MLKDSHLMKRTKMLKSNTFHIDIKYNEMPDSLKSAISSCRILISHAINRWRQGGYDYKAERP
jgi:hypothetical protein